MTDLVKALATVPKTRRATQVAGIDVSATTKAMGDFTAAKHKGDLHRRLHGAGGPPDLPGESLRGAGRPYSDSKDLLSG